LPNLQRDGLAFACPVAVLSALRWRLLIVPLQARLSF
jgi:hypothetical protein